MTKPTKPTVPPAPSRSNPGATFSQTADTFAAFQSVFADYLDATAEFVDDRADAALAAALGGSLPPLTGQTGRFLRVASPTSVTFSPELIQDANGNLGLGVTPSAWGSNSKAFQFTRGASTGSLASVLTSDEVFVFRNAYHDNTNFRYVASNFATAYQQSSDGKHIWQTAPSGTAGNAITFTQTMTLDAAGNLGVGTASPRNAGAGFKGITLDGSTSGFLDINANGTRVFTVFGSASGVEFVNPTSGFLSFLTNNTERARIAANGQMSTTTGAGNVMQAFDCRAWVNFNGTNGAIRASGNVASVVRNSAADYTINFATAMPDANYAVIASSGAFTTSDSTVSVSTTPTTTSCRVFNVNAGVAGDNSHVHVAFFR